jgi:transcriptional regulator with XRE-family HTH domain
LELNRLDLAIRSGVSPSWIAALEAGLRPARGSAALDRLEASLAELEAADKPRQPVEAA